MPSEIDEVLKSILARLEALERKANAVEYDLPVRDSQQNYADAIDKLRIGS